MSKSTLRIRLVGTAAAFCALVICIVIARPVLEFGKTGDIYLSDLWMYLAAVVLPSFVNVFLIPFGRCWWALGIGLWLLAVAVMIARDQFWSGTSVVLIVAATAVCAMSVLDRVYRNKPVGR
jgi:hypothetical protein